jgi:hypothetical protein
VFVNAVGRGLCGAAVLVCGLGACNGRSQRESNTCTAVGCGYPLTIEVYPRTGWPAGDYRFVIEHDRQTTVCEARIPLPPCERVPDELCSKRDVAIGGVGCNRPPSEQALGNRIIFYTHPAVVGIDVFRDGVRLTHAHWDIEYHEFWPNGRECGTVCFSALTPTDLTLS